MKISAILLFLFVIVLGIEIGGGLYETLVVMPHWSAAPPESVLAYYQHNSAEPQFALNAGGRFWMFFTPLTGLLALLALLTGFRTNPRHRGWRILGTSMAILVVAFTFAWFVPNIIALNSEAVTQMSRDEVTSTTNAWVTLNWIRVVVYSSAWLAALRALSLPASVE